MKTNSLLHCQLPALAAGLFLSLPYAAHAAATTAALVEEAAPAAPADKQVIKEEITATGTVFSVEPEILSVVMKDNPTPVRFSYNKDTPFLDEKGTKVPLDLVRAELPLTVHYLMDGEKMVASRVVMSRSMVAGDATEKPDKKRLELAEEKAEENTRAVQAERNGPREFMGTLSTIEQTISLVPRGETIPTTCIINNSTRFVNLSGQPVSPQLLMPGVPVSVKTIRDGKRVIAQEIIVRGDSPPPAAGGTPPQGATGGAQNSRGTGTSTGSSNGYPGLIPGQGYVIPGQINPAPGVPGVPAQPANPNQPGNPAAPGQPTNPNNPTQPGAPANPAQPGNPNAPVQPGTAQPNVPPAGANTPPAGGNTPPAGGTTPRAGGNPAPPQPAQSGSGNR